MRLWDAKSYDRFEAERARPANELVARIPKLPKRIVDLGCGSGLSTLALRQAFPKAEILGVDLSPDMLKAAAKRLPTVKFRKGDAATFDARGFDLVFANAVFHWVPDHLRVLAKLAASLPDGGALAVQMPDNRQEPSHALMRLIAADGPWADRLVPIAKTRAVIAPYGDYYRWLKPLSAALDIWQTAYIHPLEGIEAIVDWFRGSALRPFLAPLSPPERQAFLERYRRDLSEAYEVESDGKVLFVYPRLFLLALKSG